MQNYSEGPDTGDICFHSACQIAESLPSALLNNCGINIHKRICSLFIHSGYFYSASSNPLLLSGAYNNSVDTAQEFHAEAPQATASEGLAQGPYVAARAGFKPLTLWTKGDESTNETPYLTMQLEVT